MDPDPDPEGPGNMWIRWIRIRNTSYHTKNTGKLEVCVLRFIILYFSFLLFEQAWQAGDKPFRL